MSKSPWSLLSIYLRCSQLRWTEEWVPESWQHRSSTEREARPIISENTTDRKAIKITRTMREISEYRHQKKSWIKKLKYSI